MFSRFYRLCALAFVTLFLSVSVGIGIGGAFSWVDLLFQGARIIQLSTLSDRQEVVLGQQIDRGLWQQRKIATFASAGLDRYIDEVGQRLAATCERPDIPYTFRVVRDGNVNAFATMGGFVYLNAGLIRFAANEAELAGVIAHEIGHIAHRHALNRLRDEAISRGLLSAAGLDRETWVQLGVTLVQKLPGSRQDELAADRAGLTNLIEAGYAPGGMVSFLEKMRRPSGSPPSFLSTHPATEERVALLRRAVEDSDAEAGDGLDRADYLSRTRALR